ncbi:hypothetical protein ACIPPR_13400 [Streptomyces nigra]|uniref:hypothetical protein n=1 Tax=Streptomyces nigra TaxID=1827580 RepID=UPI00381B1B95
MSLEGHHSSVPEVDPYIAAGMSLAAQWGTALGGPEKLEVSLKALEPVLKREHQLRLRQLELQAAAAEHGEAAKEAADARTAAAEEAKADRAAREVIEKRHHTYRMATLIAGMTASLSMLGGGIYLAPANPWLAAGLCGPSMLALVKIFVLKRSDDTDMCASERTAREVANATQTTGSPPVV